MNILQIGTTDTAGGAASISWTLKKELEKRGYAMPMFVADKKSAAADVFVLPRKLHKYFQMVLSNDLDYSDTDWILTTKEFKNADIVHLHNLHGWFFNLKTLEKMSKLKPVIWTLHDMWAITPHCAHSYECEVKDGFYQCPSLSSYPRILFPNKRHLTNRKRRIYENALFSVITPSLWLREKVSKSVLKDKKISLVYNGVDQSVFKSVDRNRARKELGISQDKKIILFLSDGGKKNEFKGWNFIESSMEKLRSDNILFISIGGDEEGRDKKYPNLEHVRRINDKELLVQYFSVADVFLYPSLADNCPLVVLEAMACGVPIVTFNIGGIPELVSHLENGYIAQHKDSNDLVKGIEYILGLSQSERDYISQQSIKKINDKFTQERMVENYVDIYKSLMRK